MILPLPRRLPPHLVHDKVRRVVLKVRGVLVLQACDERSDEQKVISYVGGRYDAVASLQPSFALPHLALSCSK